MNDHQLSRPRSGDQWVPRRTAAPTISVTVEPRERAHNLPFGFGIRDEQPVEVEAEWEGNPS